MVYDILNNHVYRECIFSFFHYIVNCIFEMYLNNKTQQQQKIKAYRNVGKEFGKSYYSQNASSEKYVY